jgi:hypothetical protein
VSQEYSRTRRNASAILAFAETTTPPINCDLARVFSHTASPCVLAASTTTAPLLNLHLLYNITMHTSEYDYLFKLLLIGDSGVGKVCAKGLVLLFDPDSCSVVHSPVYCCVSQTTHTPRAISALSASTSRFELLSSRAKL